MAKKDELPFDNKEELLKEFDEAARVLNMDLPFGYSFVRIIRGSKGRPDKCMVIKNIDVACVWNIKSVDQKTLLKKGYKKLLLKHAGKEEKRARRELKKVSFTNFHTTGKISLREQLFSMYHIAENG